MPASPILLTYPRPVDLVADEVHGCDAFGRPYAVRELSPDRRVVRLSYATPAEVAANLEALDAVSRMQARLWELFGRPVTRGSMISRRLSERV